MSKKTAKQKIRSYSEVFKADYKENKAMELQGFSGDYSYLDKLYKYCRSNRCDKGYDSIIQCLIKQNNKYENENQLMNNINYIALWKTNRIIEFENPEKIITLINIFKKNGGDENAVNLLDELLKRNNKGIDLPMASTILHFFRSEYPIIDRRAHRALYKNYSNLPFKISEPTEIANRSKIKKYFHYVERCKEVVEAINNEYISMNNVDQFLYQIDKMTGEPLKDYKI